MDKTSPPNGVTHIPVDQYPAMVDGLDAKNFLRVVTSPEAAKRATTVIGMRRNQLADAVLGYIKDMERAAASGDLTAVFSHAHEIRGLAATAGMEAVGRIADGLCKYLDTVKSLSFTVDSAVVALHVDAIVRASGSAGDASAYGQRVAAELNALVAYKLSQSQK